MAGKSSSSKQTKQRGPEVVHALRARHAPALARGAGRRRAHPVDPTRPADPARRTAPVRHEAPPPRLAHDPAAPPPPLEALPIHPRHPNPSHRPLRLPANDRPRLQNPAPLHRPLLRLRKAPAGPAPGQGPDPGPGPGPDPGLGLCPLIVSAKRICRGRFLDLRSRSPLKLSGFSLVWDFACFSTQTLTDFFFFLIESKDENDFSSAPKTSKCLDETLQVMRKKITFRLD